MTADAPMWAPAPERAAGTDMAAFLAFVRERHGLDLPDYMALWRWSCDHSEDFWVALWDFADVIAETRGNRVLVDGDDQLKARFFPDARLNFAENMLRRNDDAEAIVFLNERGDVRRLTWRELNAEVARLAEAFIADGVQPGDRVAAYMPNVPETAVVMLAATAVGATFSSCAPDFGVRGVLDRFGQLEPTVLVAADGYHYNGTTYRVTDRVAQVMTGLPSLRRTILFSYVDPEPDLEALPGAVGYAEYVAPHRPDAVPYRRLPFDQPLFILFSSGTTGAPKCIVHGAGGTLLQSIKETRLHLDARPDDRVLFFTSTTWVVWNLHITFLLCRSTVLLYEGSPFHPGPDALFDYMDRERATHFGTSAKFIDAIKQAGVEPRRGRALAALRVVMSSGSALLPESFDYIYETVGRDLQLSSISGGTDIMCGFLSGNPIGPVWRGELQAPALGMAVEVWDDDGRPLGPGEKGELVCTRPHPSIPLKFMGDPDGSRRRAAYFEHYPGTWRHGDLMEWTEHDGGSVIYGRSDATLNPGGVRIGTAEIYRPVEQLDEVVEAIAVGQDWPPDTRIVLFVVLREGLTLDDPLREKIKAAIRAGASPRHVPARIAQVSDIPRTKTGKIVELAVRDVVHGRTVKNVEALANPETLDEFAGREELAS